MEPPPELIEGEEEYEVDSIISHRKKGKRTEYLVSWKGYGAAENTWEPEANLKNAKQELQRYKKQVGIARLFYSNTANNPTASPTKPNS